MRIRFQADADLRVPIIKGLKHREPCVDFMTAHEAELSGLDDHAVLALAALLLKESSHQLLGLATFKRVVRNNREFLTVLS